jgi:VWFA-related protein
MKSRRIPAAVALLATLGLASPALLLAQALQRSLYVSVLDESGAVVRDLGEKDFVVREDNLAREVLRVAPATAPMQVALLIDNSAYTSRYIRDFREAAKEFVLGMTSGPVKHEVAIIGIAERPTLLTDYTSDQKKLEAGVGRIFTQSQGGLYLLDGIYESANALKKREASRPVIVAVATDGREFSNRYHDQILTALAGAGAALHAVILGPPGAEDVVSTEGRERAMSLDMGTKATGGRYDNVIAASALPARLKQVADELTHQYLVTYARPDQLIPPEKTTVSATRPGLTARGTPVKASGRP